MAATEELESKVILVSYNGSSKLFKIPVGDKEFEFLKNQCKYQFKFGTNVNLEIVFQKYDPEWEEFIDFDEGYVLTKKEKLQMVVQPTLVDESLKGSEVSVS